MSRWASTICIGMEQFAAVLQHFQNGFSGATIDGRHNTSVLWAQQIHLEEVRGVNCYRIRKPNGEDRQVDNGAAAAARPPACPLFVSEQSGRRSGSNGERFA